MKPIYQCEINANNTNSLIKFCEANDRYDTLIPIIPSGFKYPLYIRRATTDIYNFLQVFEEKEYDNIESPPTNVLDLGAYVGYVASYFAVRYNAKKIICVEPDDENYRMLLLNTMPYKNIRCIRGAVWDRDCKLSITTRNGGDWGTMVGENPDGDIDGFSINSLMRYHDITSIDFLKMDIEGSELAVFNGDLSWVNHVTTIHAELHDNVASGCTQAYRSIFDSASYKCRKHNQYERYTKI